MRLTEKDRGKYSGQLLDRVSQWKHSFYLINKRPHTDQSELNTTVFEQPLARESFHTAQ